MPENEGRIVTKDELFEFAAAEVARLHAEHGDPFRRHHVPLSTLQQDLIGGMKDEAISIYALIATLPASRERSLALTHLELAIMLAVKAVTAKGGGT